MFSHRDLSPQGQHYYAELLEATQAVLRDSGTVPGDVPCSDEALLHAIAERMEVGRVDSMAVRECLETLYDRSRGR